MPPIRIENFGRPGALLRSGSRAPLLDIDQFSELRNVWQRHGALVKRGGAVIQGASLATATVRWLAHAYNADTSAALVVRMALCGTVLRYKITSGSWTDFATGLTAGTYPISATYKDQVWWCDGTNTPLKISIANPPVDSSWGGLPSGINPQWVLLFKNRLYYGGDKSTPTIMYMSNPGLPETTTTTDSYQIPDDQRGFYPRIAVAMGEGVGLFAQDYKVYMTGTGPLSHRMYHFEKAAAAIYWRSVVATGDGRAIYMTENGPYIWDGHSTAEPLDPNGEQNWGDIDFTTNEDTWAIRYGDYYILAYKSKGDVTTAATGTAFSRFSSVYAAATRAIKVTGADSNTARCFAYNMITKQWSQHDFPYACGAWEEALHGDTQDLWVGSATGSGARAGEVYKWDQAGTWRDDSVDYDCVIKTGALGDSFLKNRIERVKVKCRVSGLADAKMRVAVYQDGKVHEPPVWEDSVGLGRTDAQGGPATKYNPVQHREGPIVKIAKPKNPVYEAGFETQIEFRYSGNDSFEFDGYEAEVKAAGE
ncbi:MAG: hypothetical protein NUW01_03165 [Gemmatimonadaceae bacterium]|nr:hypothetical protein [Gemmatimonadaceae bacterium]